MLKKFSVKNFKNFKDKLEIDFSSINDNFNFNENLIVNNIINKAAIYGKNASGKSNLGLAIFDIVKNLTDKESQPNLYRNYLCALSDEKHAEFSYEFQFGKSKVVYNYLKSDYENILFEELLINGKVIVKYDRREKELPTINLPEASSLNKKIGNIKISLVKYLKNNTIISTKSTLHKFFKFVDNMLFSKV